MKRMMLVVALAGSFALSAHAEDTASADTPARTIKEAPTGTRIQRLPDITVNPTSVSRGPAVREAGEQAPEMTDEADFLAE